MNDERRVISVDDFEHNLLINGMNDYRNDLIEEDKPTEDVDELLIKLIDAPRRHGLRSLVLPSDGQKLDRSVASPLPTESADSAGAPIKKRKAYHETR